MRFGTVAAITATTTTLTSTDTALRTRPADAVGPVRCGGAGDGLTSLPSTGMSPPGAEATDQGANPSHTARGCAAGR